MSKHETFKAEKCGRFLGKIKSYIAASPDGIVTWKCHGNTLIKIKCSYSIHHKKILEFVREFDFHIISNNGRVSLSCNYKYYTPVISQYQFQDSLLLLCSVDTKKKYGKIIFDRNHWGKVLINVNIFYKIFPCMIATFRFLPNNILCKIWQKFYWKKLKSNICEICGAWLHYKCKIMSSRFDTELDWICSAYLLILNWTGFVQLTYLR